MDVDDDAELLPAVDMQLPDEEWLQQLEEAKQRVESLSMVKGSVGFSFSTSKLNNNKVYATVLRRSLENECHRRKPGWILKKSSLVFFKLKKTRLDFL